MDLLRALILTCALAGALSACASSTVRLPELGPHVGDEPVIVPYPPPPARVEIVPPAPDKHAVWVDGQWLWRGRRWVWQSGGFRPPLSGTYYALPVTIRRADGSLAYYEGAFQARRAKSPPRQ